jgi:nitrogenase-stabilizing/protective protein
LGEAIAMITNLTTPNNLSEFLKLSTAEEYFQFFDLPYQQSFVNINRLHILKQFSLFIEEINSSFPHLTEEEKLNKYREALIAAYELFFHKSPLETKLFKVLQQKPNNVVLLQDIGIDSEE